MRRKSVEKTRAIHRAISVRRLIVPEGPPSGGCFVRRTGHVQTSYVLRRQIYEKPVLEIGADLFARTQRQ